MQWNLDITNLYTERKPRFIEPLYNENLDITNLYITKTSV